MLTSLALFITYKIFGGIVGRVHVSFMPSLVVHKGYSIGTVRHHLCFSLYRIIEGLGRPAHVPNFDHALTGTGNH